MSNPSKITTQVENSSLAEICSETNQQVAGFVAKTFQILNMNDYAKIIYWSANGTQFTIKDIVKFEEIVLPRFFRHSKINSFVRQLNMYGFHKTKHDKFKSIFKHPFFQKNQEQLLPFVKRKFKANQENQTKNQDRKEIAQNNNKSNKINPVEKQPEATSVSLEKLFNFSNEFVDTTKMINYSLKKVSFTDFNNLQICPEKDRSLQCASIEDQLQKQYRNQEMSPVFSHPVLTYDPKCEEVHRMS